MCFVEDGGRDQVKWSISPRDQYQPRVSHQQTHTHTHTSFLPERKCSVHKYLEFANWKNLCSFALGGFFKHSSYRCFFFFLELSAALFISARWNELRLSYTRRFAPFYRFYRLSCLAIKGTWSRSFLQASGTQHSTGVQSGHLLGEEQTAVKFGRKTCVHVCSKS